MSNRPDIYKAHKSFKNDLMNQFQKLMDNMRELRDDGEDKKAKRKSRELTKKVGASGAVMTAEFAHHDSSSDSETDSQKDIITAALQDNITKTSEIRHHVYKLERFIRDRYVKNNEEQIVIHEFFKEIFDRSLKGLVSVSDINSLREKIEKEVGSSKNFSDWAVIQENINDSIKTSEEKVAKANEEALKVTRLLQEAEQREREKDEEIMRLNQQLAASITQETSQNLAIKSTQATQLSVLQSLSEEQHMSGTSMNSDAVAKNNQYFFQSRTKKK